MDPSDGTSSPIRSPRVVLFLYRGSVKGRQTEAMAEVGWILARAGHRVLIADADAPSPEVPGWLRHFPFLSPSHPAPNQSLISLATLLSQAQDVEPDRRRLVLPGPAGALDVLTWPSGTTLVGQVAPAPSALRTLIDRQPYDDLLLSCRPELDDVLLDLCDVIALGFSATKAAVMNANALASRLITAGYQRQLVGLVLGPLAMDDSTSQMVRREFRPTIQQAGRQWLGFVEVGSGGSPPPIDRVGAGDATTGYAAAVKRICPDPIQVPELPEGFIRRFQHCIEDSLGAGLTPEPVSVVYAPKDRLWADWAADELRRYGLDVRLCSQATAQRPEATNVVVLIGSPHALPEPLASWTAQRFGPASSTSSTECVYLRILQDDPVALPGTHLVDLSAVSGAGIREDEAKARLRAPFLLTQRDPDQAPGAGRRRSWRVRFPRTSTPRAAVSIPSLSGRFVGRDRELEQLRDGLLSGTVQVVTGAPGVGKSELAIAYAARFGQDYDAVWFVPATSRQSIHESLTVLREQPGTGTAPGGTGNGPGAQHLVIFDAADDLSVLDQLPRAAVAGHVMVTARGGTAGVAERAAAILQLPCAEVRIGDLPPEQAIRILARRVTGLRPDDAERILHRTGSTALTLRLAEGGLASHAAIAAKQGYLAVEQAELAVDRYLNTLPGGSDLARQPEPEPELSGAALALAAIGSVIEEAPDRIGRIALRMAQMCTFLSCEGVPLDLLRDTAMVEQLIQLADDAWTGQSGEAEGTAFARDLSQFDEMLWFGDQVGLFDIDWGRTASLRMNRVTAQLLRAAMPRECQEQTQSAVLAGLARYAPNDAQLQIAPYRKLQQLRRHLEPSGALLATDWATRQLVVKQLESIQRYGDQTSRQMALDLADGLRKRWSADPPASADLLLRLDQIRAMLHHELNDLGTAASMQLRLLEDLTAALGPDHFRTLLAADLAAWMLQELGQFDRASAQAEQLIVGVRRVFGVEHPVSLRMAYNLSRLLLLAGKTVRAQSLGRATLTRLQAHSGRRDRVTWRCASSLGYYHLHLGNYQQAQDLFDQSVNAAQDDRHLPEIRQMLLRMERGQAAALRALGRPRARELNRQVLQQRRTPEGHDPLETPACLVAVATDHYSSGDRAGAMQAVNHATEALSLYQRLPDGHPLQHLCRLNLAVFQHAAQRPAEAVQTAEEALNGLRERLDPGHPWVLAAAANHCALTALTDPDADLTMIADRLATIVQHCYDSLQNHPSTRAAEANLTRVRRALASGQRSWQAAAKPLRLLVIDIP
ncbi:MAG: tetratricopeptide repeat protein [Micromonosporaceae bacterium]|nr:tetratricopeptide repeat protein [Micromonosporaceae bacterium]